jgi:histone-lysine N-methyltransferase SETMAR
VSGGIWKGLLRAPRPNKTINSEVYSQQLDLVNECLKEKRPHLVNRKGVVFHQDNARPHVSKMTQQKIKELNCEILTTRHIHRTWHHPIVIYSDHCKTI